MEFINKVNTYLFSRTTNSEPYQADLSPGSYDGNGNIILGYEIPNEILLSIFQNIPDEYLIKTIPLVCKQWRELSRSWDIWKIRLQKCQIRLSKLRQDIMINNWHNCRYVAAVQWLCFNKKGFNQNLLKNPSGAESFNHWTVHHGGDNLIIEEPPVGCDPIPDEARLPTQHCFVSSFGSCKRTQSISLCRDFGIKPFLLPILQPTLLVSEWVTARFDCGGESTMQTVVIGSNDQPAIFISRWKDSDYGRVEWHKMKMTIKFEDLPENMSTIRFKNISKDTQFWAGHYGAKTTGSSVILDISTDFE